LHEPSKAVAASSAVNNTEPEFNAVRFHPAFDILFPPHPNFIDFL
jgi:hypothetical protein